MRFFSAILISSILWILSNATVQAEPENWSGIYPHLAFFNEDNECGTGAVVPWAGRLWAITYAPHRPQGSTDKLYEISPELVQTIRPESIGGTPANRMIHRESRQLFIGPYAIDSEGRVRVIPYSKMFGRPTGNARHLTDPAEKIYCASMEEAFYEIDVTTLAVNVLYRDEQDSALGPKADLPGYHGKGLYSGQGVLVYANNGEHSPEARTNPFIPSGALTEWDGKEWKVVRRNQFTEVTGPGGIYGNDHPETDPLWSIGWDARSLILMLRDDGQWHSFRLPKASNSYDGAHGWNTEWPRIREIGEGDDFLMTMHGTFWKFPKTFSLADTSGITPRSTYLKVIGDFCRWEDRIVFGCDDTAKSEFLNKRRAKGSIAAPQSQSNLWFLPPEKLDHLGPVVGKGAVWLKADVSTGSISDPYLFGGLTRRALHLAQTGATEAQAMIEVDRDGKGRWEPLQSVTLPPAGSTWLRFADDEPGVWVRIVAKSAIPGAAAVFTNVGKDERRPTVSDFGKFDGLSEAKASEKSAITGGVIRPRDKNKRNLHFAAHTEEGPLGLYTLSDSMQLEPEDNPNEFAWLEKAAAIPSREGVLSSDAASIIYSDDAGTRFRLPRHQSVSSERAIFPVGERLCREVATERDLFHCDGTFYELPAENAGGFRRVRPVASHDFRIVDYCSYRGLLILSGIDLSRVGKNHHVIRSSDGKTALWAGAVDDLWDLGKPTGSGGPWKNAFVKAGDVSDPYLMSGFDETQMTLSSDTPVELSIEIDLTGMDDWTVYRRFTLEGEKAVTHTFPDGFQASWLRCRSSGTAKVTIWLEYR